MEIIKVMLINNYPILGYGIRRMLEQNSHISIVYHIAGQRELHQVSALVQQHSPNIVLVDANSYEDAKIVNQIKLICRFDFKIMILTTQYEKDFLSKIMDIRADGYISGNTKPDQLIRAIQSVYNNQFYIQPDLMNQLVNKQGSESKISNLGGATSSDLTNGEIEILELIASGKSNKDISNILSISEEKVKYNIANIMKKLNVSNRTQAAERVNDYICNFRDLESIDDIFLNNDNLRNMEETEEGT